ncbi:hypothetical protein ACOSQ3_008201 [Xanthoceras sorbifolium]
MELRGPVYYVSKALTDPETRYTKVEKIVLALIISARRLRPYFQAYPITVLTNYPFRQVMQKLEASGRIIKWFVELSEFDLTYKPRSAIKGQAIADFLLESIQGDAFSIDRQEDESWKLFVDGSSNRHGSGAGVIIQSPNGTIAQLALRFGFWATNNIA